MYCNMVTEGMLDGKVKVRAARCTATWLPRGMLDGKVKVKAARCTATWLPTGEVGR